MLKKIKGFIFDLDDTIVESEQLNVDLISEYFHGTCHIDLDDEDKNVVFGHPWQHIYDFIITKYNLPISIDDVQSGVVKRKKEYLKNHKLKVATGIDLVLGLAVRNVIVSGSGKEEIKIMLENVHLSLYFEHIISADDYEMGKPEPDGFIMALDYLGLAHDEVLAFEDSKSGIEAAKKAGLPTVFIKEFAQEDYSGMSDLSFDHFKSFYDYFLKYSKPKP